MQIRRFDPDLGLLEYQDIEGLSSYNCKVTLPISKKQVEIFFETTSKDRLPSVEQKKFIQHVVDDYNSILLSLVPVLPNEIKVSEQNKKSFLRDQFDLDTMGVAINVKVNGRWDLSLV